MWAHRLTGPSKLEPLDVPAPRPEDLQDGEVLLKFRSAAICGSDIPQYQGRIDPSFPYNGEAGFPLHENVGDRLVGIVNRHNGLQEYIVNPARYLYALNGSRLTDEEAPVIQPLATVFNAINRLPDP